MHWLYIFNSSDPGPRGLGMGEMRFVSWCAFGIPSPSRPLAQTFWRPLSLFEDGAFLALGPVQSPPPFSFLHSPCYFVYLPLHYPKSPLCAHSPNPPPTTHTHEQNFFLNQLLIRTTIRASYRSPIWLHLFFSSFSFVFSILYLSYFANRCSSR